MNPRDAQGAEHHREEKDSTRVREAQRTEWRTTKPLLTAAFSVAIAVVALLRWTVESLQDEGYRLVYDVLIHLAAETYTDAEIYDPFFDSEDYEFAREMQAIESLLTGRLAESLGVCTIIRLLGGTEPMTGQGFLLAAERETDAGDLVFLTFEYEHIPARLEENEAYRPGLTVAVLRTDAESPWSITDRVEAADTIFALIEFYSERSPRQKRA